MISDFNKCIAIGLMASLSAFLAPDIEAKAQETWDPKYYNPAGGEDMLFLPIPCGGKIALRKIVTVTEDLDSAAGPLSDQRVTLGRDAGRTRGYIEEDHTDYIAGTLNDVVANQRYYLIGAYEVTLGQYEAVTKGPDACPRRMSRKLNQPVTNVSWYDAVDFTRKLNGWLYGNEESMMPLLVQIGAENGFVRLPTEVEWEYAARGGSKVSSAQRNEPLFFSDGTMDDYAWYNGATSSGGKPKLIGKKKPNPAGLYDVYGNAEEIVLEPFRMRRPDRVHGAIGGYVTRGGSFKDQPDLINSARRDEHPFFSAELKGEFKRRTMGFRIMVGTSSMPRDVDQVPRLESAFEEAQRQVEGDANDQPLQQMADMASQVENEELRAKIDQLQNQLQQEFTRRNALKARNLRVTLSSGGLQAMEVYLSARAIKSLKAGYQQAKETKVGMDFYPPKIRAEFGHFTLIEDAYFETVDTLSAYSDEELERQASIVKRSLMERGDENMKRFVEQLQISIRKFRQRRNRSNLLHFINPIPEESGL
ncbi:formylglycine-generating enzyme family protein [Cohaesibacter intestini]|uniref:formylglycine-generating enzyme family protein n=1 Tax=Cohaesibacter intestini TaxID=2211145 RepID=UPI0013002DF2|nr:SUMF1/EgtB/PvdO family nonheme iron enzyme [Cohaesibacter intestini]